MKQVSCSCGHVAFAETADELLAVVEAHIAASHGAELRADPSRVESPGGAVAATNGPTTNPDTDLPRLGRTAGRPVRDHSREEE